MRETEQPEHAEQGDLGQQQQTVGGGQVAPAGGPQQAVDQPRHGDGDEAPAGDDRVPRDRRGQVGADPPDQQRQRGERADPDRGADEVDHHRRRRDVVPGGPGGVPELRLLPERDEHDRGGPGRAGGRGDDERERGDDGRDGGDQQERAAEVDLRDEDAELRAERRRVQRPAGDVRVREHQVHDRQERPGARGEPGHERAARVRPPVGGADAGAGGPGRRDGGAARQHAHGEDERAERHRPGELGERLRRGQAPAHGRAGVAEQRRAARRPRTRRRAARRRPRRARARARARGSGADARRPPAHRHPRGRRSSPAQSSDQRRSPQRPPRHAVGHSGDPSPSRRARRRRDPSGAAAAAATRRRRRPRRARRRSRRGPHRRPGPPRRVPRWASATGSARRTRSPGPRRRSSATGAIVGAGVATPYDVASAAVNRNWPSIGCPSAEVTR